MHFENMHCTGDNQKEQENGADLKNACPELGTTKHGLVVLTQEKAWKWDATQKTK